MSDGSLGVSVWGKPEFVEFVELNERALLRAVGSKYGAEAARDAVAEAVTVAWEQCQGERPANPAGFVYRVADRLASKAAARSARHIGFGEDLERSLAGSGMGDRALLMDLAAALGELSPRQRQAVLMVKAWGYSYAETAVLLEIAEPTMRNHLDRGMAKLRELLSEEDG